MRKINGWGIPAAALEAVQTIGAKTFLRPCVHEDGTAAACAGAGTWLLALGAAVLALSLALTLTRSGKGRTALSAAALLGGVLTALTPGTLQPICAMASMRCQMVTRPAALVLGVLTAGCAALSLAAAVRSQRKA